MKNMNRYMILGLAALTLSPLSTLAAQQNVRDRAREALPADVFNEVSALADEVSASGVPGDPLCNTALEGMA